MISLRKVNNEIVHAIKNDIINIDKRPMKGEALFSEIYANIFIVAKKKSGKTTVIAKIVKECTTTETTVLVFCATLEKDNEHLAIKKYCKSKGIPYQGYTSMKEDGIDVLEVLIKKLQDDAKEPESDEEEKEDSEKRLLLFESSEDEEDQQPKKKPKFRAPEYMLIFDDLSNELKSKVLTRLLKMNRHFKMKILVSTQYPNDILPESIKQTDYALIFAGEHEDKLTKLHKELDLAIDFETFKKIYHYATKDKYNFLYIDVRSERYRKNFNKEFNIKNNILE